MKKILISLICTTLLCSCISHSRWIGPTTKKEASKYKDVIGFTHDKYNRIATVVTGTTKWRDGEVDNVKIADFTMRVWPESRKHIAKVFYADMNSFCECKEGTFYDLSFQDEKRLGDLLRKNNYTEFKTALDGSAMFECGPKGQGSISTDWTKYNPSNCRKLYENKVNYKKVKAEYGNPPNFICKKQDGIIFTGRYERKNRLLSLYASRLRDLDRISKESNLIHVQLNQAKSGLISEKDMMQMVKIDDYHIKRKEAVADSKDAEVQFKLGVHYEKGRGVRQNYIEAAKCYKRAAILGHALAQDYLGFLYSKGRGVPKDDTEAIKWFRKSADQGSRSGQNNLGYMYDVGRGVAQNYDEAFKWYKRAAAQGHLNAQSNIGYMYLMGRGVSKNYSEAFRWFRKSANEDGASGQYNLGYMYSNGLGVPKDNIEAAKWYERAALQGHPGARSALERINKKIYNTK